MKPATEKIHTLRAKLRALAERGVNGEATAAKYKLACLEARFDFNTPRQVADLFAGKFKPATSAAPVGLDLATHGDCCDSVKWAIERGTGIRCLYRAGQLCAEATPATCARLETIARTIAENFTALWARLQTAPGIQAGDRQCFTLGLYDGLMGEHRENQPLPRRAGPVRLAKAKRKAVGHVAGITLHPYSIALDLGRQIRHTVPLDEINRTLENKITQALPAATQ